MLEGKPSPARPTPAPAGDTFARLHISPLDADLLKVVVPAAALPNARNISYHTIETFPERRYGFVELPSADAEKVRKKFHGSTLKGSKMRVEKARPEKTRGPDAEEDTGKKRKKKGSDDKDGASKKRKRDYNTVEGVLLPEGRKVKRGWTVTTDEARKEKKKGKAKDKEKEEKRARKVKSRFTDKEECLMKTVLPPNAPTAADVAAKNQKKKKKGKAKREVVVHEFEDTTKFPSFLKASSDVAPVKGSVTPSWPGISNATTGEEAKPIEKPVVKPAQKHAEKPVDVPVEQPEDDAQSTSNGTGDSDSDSSSDEEAANTSKAKPDSDSSDEDDGGSESASSTGEENEDVRMSSPGSARPKSSGSAKNLSIQIPSTPAPAEVHPLEALYKKNKDEETVQATPAAEPFSFFGGGGSDDEGEEEDLPPRSSQPPMTPFTKQDFEQRNVRSAAPTPDTAHPTRTRMFWAPNEEDDLQEEDEPESPRPAAAGGAEDGEADPASDFHGWFYENRRELSRGWVERRKAAKKERRQRDNRAKGR